MFLYLAWKSRGVKFWTNLMSAGTQNQDRFSASSRARGLGKPKIFPFWCILCQKSTRLVLQLLCVTRGCVWCWEFADCMLPASHIFGKSTLSVPSEAEELFKRWEKAGQDQTLWNLLWNIHGNCYVMAAVWSSVQYFWNKAIQWVILMNILFSCPPGESFARGHHQTVLWKLLNSHRARPRGKSKLRNS